MFRPVSKRCGRSLIFENPFSYVFWGLTKLRLTQDFLILSTSERYGVMKMYFRSVSEFIMLMHDTVLPDPQRASQTFTFIYLNSLKLSYFWKISFPYYRGFFFKSATGGVAKLDPGLPTIGGKNTHSKKKVYIRTYLETFKVFFGCQKRVNERNKAASYAGQFLRSQCLLGYLCVPPSLRSQPLKLHRSPINIFF